MSEHTTAPYLANVPLSGHGIIVENQHGVKFYIAPGMIYQSEAVS